MRLLVYGLVCIMIGTCSDDAETEQSSSAQTSGSTISAASSSSGSGGAGGGESCHGTLRPADAERFVVVGHPYDANAAPANVYEVLRLSSAGELLRSGSTVSLGRPADRPIVFTPDGALGFAVQDDGIGRAHV